MALLPSCQNLDDIYRRLDDYESRLVKVEELTEGANRDIVALQALLQAQDQKLSIVSWRALDDNTGYLLTMSDGSTITLKNGKDGISSSIDVRRGEDGILYWTLNGEYMYDTDGNKIKAQGIDGESGVTPQLRVSAEGYWEYSLDGVNWMQIKDDNRNPVKATPDTEDLGLDIQETPDGMIIITFKGKTFVISKSGAVTPDAPAATVSFTTNFLTANVGDKGNIEYKIEPADADASGLKWMSSREDIVKVNQDGSFEALAAGTADITAMLGTSSATLTIAVTAPEEPGELKEVDFKLEIVKNTPTDVVISIKSPDPDMMYIANCAQASLYYEHGGRESIHEDWIVFGWKSQAGDNWKSFIPIYDEQGDREESIHNTEAVVRPGVDYVFFIYGIDSEGNQTTKVVDLPFTMADNIKIDDFTFDVDIQDYTEDGPIVVVTPSSDKYGYIIELQGWNVYGDRKDDPEKLEDLAYDMATSSGQVIYKGQTTFAPGNGFDSIKTKLKWKDYCLMVYGFDEEHGVSTPMVVKLIPKGGADPASAN